MATGTARAEHAPPPPPGAAVEPSSQERYIDRQLSRTSAHVKLVDLAGSLMTLGAAALAFLLLMSLIDHWIAGLAFLARLMAMLVLLAGAGWFCVKQLWPLLSGRVNPVYAARTIEHSTPSLKNSLVNFLLFRSQRQGVRPVVYEAIERRAASDLSHVPVDSAVDRSKVIKVGYILAGVMVVCALYKVVSPKDPLKTVARVVMPWADISRPARVSIEEVRPEDEDLYQGQTVEVSAVVRGIRDDEPVTLYYTSEDGQVVDRSIPMHQPEGAIRYECELPPGGDGVQQNLNYRIEAGDAVSREYRITMRASPSIVVRQVHYDYPSYTGRPDKTVRRQGDVKALEGTRVTIHARANYPVARGYLEFHSDTAAGEAELSSAQRRRVNFRRASIGERDVRVAFTLELAADRRTPKYTGYRLRFYTTEDQRNPQPIDHVVEVIADVPPRIEILNPAKQKIEVPVDGKATIEVRASDPDYGLRRVKLRGVSGGTSVMDPLLLDTPEGYVGQSVSKFEFSPAELGLRPGNVVKYWAIAEDTRMSSRRSNEPEPNTTRTEPEYEIRIVAPVNQERRDGDPSSDDRSGDPGQPRQDSPADQTTTDQRQEPRQENADDPQNAQDRQDGGDDQQGGDTGGVGDPSGGTAEGNDDESSDTGGPPEGGSPEAGADGGGADSGGAPGDGTPSGEEPDGSAGRENGSGGGAGQRPYDPEGADDGDIFDKINEHRQRQQGDTPPDGQGGAADRQPSGQGTPNSDGTGGGKPTTDGRPSPAPNDAQGGTPKQPGDSTGSRPGDAGNRTEQASPGTGPNGQSTTKPDAGTPQSRTGGGTGEKVDKQNPLPESGADDNRGAGDVANNKDESGGKPQGGAERPRDVPKPPGDPSAGKEPQPGQGDNGPSGAGNRGDDTTGVPEAQGANRQPADNERPGDPSSPESGPDAKSPSNSNRQSKSEGGQGGDRSGGGSRGGGQGANQPGNDSAGSNSPGDDGAGAAQEKGQGETSNRRGSDQEAGGPTGQSGNETGPGSGRKPPSQDNTAGTTPGDGRPNGRPTQQGSDPAGDGSGQAGAGGKPGRRRPTDNDAAYEEPGGDEVNLDYTRKATDLALRYLKDQQDDPDSELLDELGWTQDELKRFVDRWEQMKRSAARPDQQGAKARTELDESLRSLGLRPAADAIRQGGTRTDANRRQTDSGRRGSPPAEYLEQYKAYLKGTARAAEK